MTKRRNAFPIYLERSPRHDRRLLTRAPTMDTAPLCPMVPLSGPLSDSTATLRRGERLEKPPKQLLPPGTRSTRGSARSEGRQPARKRLPGQPHRRAPPTAGERGRRRRL